MEPVEGIDKKALFLVSMNVIASILGSGVLGLPYAVAETGWLGIGLLLFTATVQTWTGYLLFASLSYCADGTPIYFSDLVEKVGGSKIWRVFSDISLVVNNSGTAVLYLVLSGQNFASLLTPIFPHVSSATWSVLVWVVILPSVLLRNMSEVAALSFFGTMASLIVVGVVVSHDATELSSTSATWTDEPTKLTVFTALDCLSTMAFAYAPHTILPETVHHIKGDKERTGAYSLFISMPIVTLCYLAIAGTTFFTQGCDIAGDVLESSDRHNFAHSVAWHVATICITIHVSIACPIFTSGNFNMVEQYLGFDKPADQLNMDADDGRDSLEAALLRSSEEVGPVPRSWRTHLKSFALRLFMWGLILVIGLFLPFFKQLMSLLGGLTMLMSVSAPAWLWLMTAGLTAGKCMRGAAWLVLILGLLLFVATTTLAIRGLAQAASGSLPSICLNS